MIARGGVWPVSGARCDPGTTSARPFAEVGCRGGRPDLDFVAEVAFVGAPGTLYFGGCISPTSGSP